MIALKKMSFKKIVKFLKSSFRKKNLYFGITRGSIGLCLKGILNYDMLLYIMI